MTMLVNPAILQDIYTCEQNMKCLVYLIPDCPVSCENNVLEIQKKGYLKEKHMYMQEAGFTIP